MSESFLAAVAARSLDGCALPPPPLPTAPPPPPSLSSPVGWKHGLREVQSLYDANNASVGTQALALTADGKTLVTRMFEGDDVQVGVYPLGGADARGLEGHADMVCALRWDGERLATGSTDGWVRLWGVTSGVCFAKAHVGSEVLGVSLCGSYLSTGDAAQRAKVWQLGSGERGKVWMGYSQPTDGTSVRVYTLPDRPTREVVHEGSVYCARTTSRGVVSSVGYNHTDLKLWGKDGVTHELRTPAAAMRAMASSEERVFVGLKNGHVVAYELSTGALLYDFASNTAGKEVTCMDLSGTLLAVGSEYSPMGLRLWSVAGPTAELLLSHRRDSLLASVALASEAPLIAAGSTEGDVELWSPKAEGDL
jgi:WD40 repeat protein